MVLLKFNNQNHLQFICIFVIQNIISSEMDLIDESFITRKQMQSTLVQGRSHGCARVCRCHPQWQLAHLKTDAEL